MSDPILPSQIRWGTNEHGAPNVLVRSDAVKGLYYGATEDPLPPPIWLESREQSSCDHPGENDRGKGKTLRGVVAVLASLFA